VPLITIDRPEEIAALRALRFEGQREKVAGFWRQRVAAGNEIYRIVDLSNVWVITEVAEGDLAEMRKGRVFDRGG